MNEQFRSRSLPELREGSRVSARMLSALKHHHEHMVQLMGHRGLGHRTLQLKKSLRHHSTVSTIMNHHIHFSYVHLPYIALANDNTSSCAGLILLLPVPKCRVSTSAKKMYGEKKVVSNLILIQCYSSLALVLVKKKTSNATPTKSSPHEESKFRFCNS